MSERSECAGMAALSICEALLLAMKDLQVLPEHEVIGVLRDAAAFHENADGRGTDTARHHAAASLIHQIIANGNHVRRP
ncbi:hypothetical protein KUV26_20725 [Leisingera daeponensis]|uniref:Uncharacterized protein n=1 Tax=Leisingera daeponensis TaxID=405746 RepID=A0ABS7NKZ3_9RHOB|nr:hypothetical protein [Leisingera daeponensis]MBY6141868.1 hypothetical protein [Leisingera daeponensis]